MKWPNPSLLPIVTTILTKRLPIVGHVSSSLPIVAPIVEVRKLQVAKVAPIVEVRKLQVAKVAPIVELSKLQVANNKGQGFQGLGLGNYRHLLHCQRSIWARNTRVFFMQ